MGLLNTNSANPVTQLFLRLYASLLLVMLSIAVGVVGFTWFEHYNLIDSFYMTIITISTVGFAEVKPLSEPGRVFTAIYIITNIGIFTYAVSSVIGLVVEGRFGDVYNYMILEKDLSHLNNHAIVCGLGRNGLKACQEMAEMKHPFVVLEIDEAHAKYIREQYDYIVLTGDATNDEMLLKAGIMKAKSLISTLPSDSANMYVVVSARGLNGKLQIISRASSDSAEKKLILAGATHVVIPEKIGGAHMAKMVLAPGSLALMEDLYKFGGKEISFREVDIAEVAKKHQDQSIGSLIAKRSETMVIGMKTANGTFILNPQNEASLNDAVSIIMLGDDKHLQDFEDFIKKA